MDAFIGRDHELTDLLTRLPDHRLITIAAPGGMGKTRLAQEILARASFADGAYCISLAALRSAESVVQAVAETMNFAFDKQGGAPLDQLLNYLRPRRLLLCLDNLEHLVDECLPLIKALLDTAPGVHLLITSRERLNLSREMVYPLRGVTDAAVQLFEQTARHLQPNFASTPDVKKICDLVGGMPLGIILAASWVDVLPPAEILAELKRNFDLLAGRWADTPGVQAVFEYTWERLTEVEKKVFRSLAVFQGGFTREAGQQIAGASLPLLTGLITKSLVWQQNGRYSQHELLRQFAAHQLRAADQEAAVRQAHALYYAEWLAIRTPALQDHRQIETLHEIEIELENIRAAWDWLADHKDTALAQMLDGVYLFFDLRGLWSAGETWLRETAPQSQVMHARLLLRQVFLRQSGISPELATLEFRTRAYQQAKECLAILEGQPYRSDLALGWYLRALSQVDSPEEIEASAQRSLALYKQEEEPFGMAFAYFLLGFLASRHDLDQGVELTRQSLTLRRMSGEKINLLDSLINLGAMLQWQGNYDESRACYEESLRVSCALNNWLRILHSHQGLATLAFHTGDFAEAEAQCQAVLQMAVDYNYGFGTIIATHSLFYNRLAQGDYVQAWQLFYDSPGVEPMEKALGLSIAALGLGNDETARAYLQTVLNAETPAQQLGAVRGVAYLLYRQRQVEQAARLFSLAWHHSQRSQMFIKRLPLFREASVALQASQPEAWATGQQLALETALDEARNYLQNPQPLSLPPLIEPLSPREREVMLLVAAGYSNQQIAAQLFVDISTVKKHLTHIYDKLGVNSRTQALLQARRLNLL